MDGGGVLLDRNTGNLDITGAGSTVLGRPGGTLRVVPGRAGRDEDDDVACAGAACTVTVAPARGTALRTTVATGAGTRAVSGRATTVAVASAPTRTTITTTVPARAAISGVAVAPARTSTVGTNVAGRAATSAVVTAPGQTSVAVAGGQGRTTVSTNVFGTATTVAVATGPEYPPMPKPISHSVARQSSSAGDSDTQGLATWTPNRRASGPETTYLQWRVTAEPNGSVVALLTGDQNSRIGSLRAMAENAPPRAAAVGIGQLAFSEDNESVQRAAVDELARLRSRAATEQLRRIAREHPSASIRARAAAALR
jgi:hypothetical protein